jgi:hypothetical protein
MINPYFCYALAFSASLLLYQLSWSGLYPKLTPALITFLLLTICLHLLLGVTFMAKRLTTFNPVYTRFESAPIAITLFLYCLWTSEFFYEGGIPFVKIVLNQPYDYKVFGIPTLHVFIVTFSSFYTVFLFHLYLSKRSTLLLVLWVINLFAAILIYNRGMFLFNLSASAFLLLAAEGKHISFMKIGWAAGAALGVLFLFGVLGSLRVSNESRMAYTNEDFLNTGHATKSFRESHMPKEFFWTYIYITSPVANLQTNIAAENAPPTLSSFIRWMNNEVFFDFISKRVNFYFSETLPDEKRIYGPFNASTIYSRSFSYLGWSGLLLMAIIILLIPLAYLKILPVSSPFFLTGLVTLNTIFLFMVFENTVRFTGFSFQMVYPVLLHFLAHRFQTIRNIFSD